MWERIEYLVPSRNRLNLKPELEADGVPSDLDSSDPELNFANSKVHYLTNAEVREYFTERSFEAWVHSNIFTEARDEVLNADYFLLIEGRFKAREHFVPQQTSLAFCRAALRAGGLGVMDRFADRWFSPEALEETSKEKFDIRDHIAIKISNGLCRTRGMSQKFGAADYAMRVPAPHLVGATVFLLNEIASQVVQGKHYGEKSLFRWRAGAHICQLMFRPLDPESDLVVFEAVDLAIENRVVKPSVNAESAIHYLTLALPHWDLGFGWPPREKLPTIPTRNYPSLFGLTPGKSARDEVLESLGEPTKSLAPSRLRWIFQSADSENILHLETFFSDDQLTKVVGNSLSIEERIYTEDSQLQEISAALGQPTLRRKFVAPPDQAEVREELGWVLSHPERQEETLLLLLEFDPEQRLKSSVIQHLSAKPEYVSSELEPVYGKTLLTGYTPAIPREKNPLSTEAIKLRTYLESSVHLIKQLLRQFGKAAWITEDLTGYAMTVGAYLLTQGIPERSHLEEIGLPADIFLSAFEELELYLENPKTQSDVSKKAQESGVDPSTLGGFTWLLQNLPQTTPRDLDLAVDLSQVFQQYRNQLEQILPSAHKPGVS